MADLATLIRTEIPEGRQNLSDSHSNLERVAEYCEGNYFQSDAKRQALEETKNYTTQSLASVAYQINTLAYNFLQMLDLQTAQLAEMESQINHIAQTVMIHKEKVARREIGVLTTSKNTARQYKIIAPGNPERPIKYVRKPIDYGVLDDVGHGVKQIANTPRQKRTISQGSVQSMLPMTVPAASGPQTAGPAPTTKPPTPPQTVRVGGTLAKGSREYRTPPAVAPPQVPSNYAPNYPIGHPRRGERVGGYSTLPMPHSHGHAPPVPTTSTPPPQVGMVHPIPHEQMPSALQQQQQPPHPQMPPPPPPGTGEYPFIVQQGHASMPLPPSPPPQSVLPVSKATVPTKVPLGPGSEYGYRPGNISPPLPPPPVEDEQLFALPPVGYSSSVIPAEEDLPGWVPKNYLEKVVAIYDYKADKEDELSFSENATIYVLKRNDDGWWEGVLDGVTGLFPGNYVEPCM